MLQAMGILPPDVNGVTEVAEAVPSASAPAPAPSASGVKVKREPIVIKDEDEERRPAKRYKTSMENGRLTVDLTDD